MSDQNPKETLESEEAQPVSEAPPAHQPPMAPGESDSAPVSLGASDDIDQIINEIEQLQQEMQSGAVSSEPSSSKIHESSHSISSPEIPLVDQTFAHLHRSEESAPPAASSLSMVVRGSLKLVLQHHETAQEMTISFTDDSARIELSQGAVIQIPFQKKG